MLPSNIIKMRQAFDVEMTRGTKAHPWRNCVFDVDPATNPLKQHKPDSQVRLIAN